MNNLLPADLAYRQVATGKHEVRFRLAWGDLPDTVPLTRRTTGPRLRVEQVGGGSHNLTAYPVDASDPRDVIYRFTLPTPGRYLCRFSYEGWDACVVWVDASETGAPWTQQTVTGSVLDRLALHGDDGNLPTGTGGGGGLSQAQVEQIVTDALAGLEPGTAGVTSDEVDALINAAVLAFSDEVGQAFAEASEQTTAQLEQLSAEVGEAVAGFAVKADTVLTGDVTLDGATLDALRMRLLDGSRGYVLRGYSAGGGGGGLFVWDGQGRMVGKVATTGDLAAASVVVHEDASPPAPATWPPTPRQMIDLYAPLAEGLHLYRRSGLSWLVQVARADGQTSVTVTSAGAVTEAVFRDAAAESRLVQVMDGTKVTVMTAPNGTTPLKAVGEYDLGKFVTSDQVGATIGQVVAQGFTTEQVYQIIQAIPNTPVTAAEVEAIAAQVQQVDDLYTELLGTLAGWTGEIGKKADTTNSEQVVTVKSLRADGVAFRDLDFVLAVVDSPDFGERLALLRDGDSTDPNEANFVALRTDLADLYDAINGMTVRVDEVRAASEAAGQIEAAETVQTVVSVTQMLTPGEWVDLPLVDGTQTNEGMTPQMRLNAGRVELRGQWGTPTAGGNRRLFHITDPAYIPEQAHAQPLAVWEHGIDGRAGYLSVDTNGVGRFQPHGSSRWNRGNLGGIWWPAPGFTGPVGSTRPAPEV